MVFFPQNCPGEPFTSPASSDKFGFLINWRDFYMGAQRNREDREPRRPKRLQRLDLCGHF